MLFSFYKDLISLRTSHPILKTLDKNRLEVEVNEDSQVVKITRWNQDIKLIGLFNLGAADVMINDVPGKEIFNSLGVSYGGSAEAKEGILYKGQMIILESKGPDV